MPDLSGSIQTGAALGPDPFAVTLQKLDEIQKKKEDVDLEMKKGASDLAFFLKKLQAETAATKDVEGFKIQEQRKGQGLNNLEMIKALSGGNVPVGTKATIDSKGETSFNIPLNREFSSEEQTKIASSEVVTKSLSRAKDLIKELRSEKKNTFMGDLIVDFGNPLLTSGKREELLSEINNLKSIIPFAKGGKQLTINESKRLEKLLNVTGKEEDTIIRDLERFEIEFNNIRKLALEGESGTREQKEDFSKYSDEELKDILNQ